MKLRSLAIAFTVTFLMAAAQAQISHVSGSGSQNNRGYTSKGPDPIIYEQDTDFNGAFASQNDNVNGNGNFATSYDNFSLNVNSNVNSVEWIGSYFNPNVQGPITGFTINFYADLGNGNGPGALLASYFTASNAGETFLQNDNVGDPTYLYGVTLNQSFLATAGTTYWLSIVPDLGFPPQWGWETGVGGDGAAWQCFLGTCGALASDLSFALDGTAQTGTPEPGTFIMLGTGILGLAGTLRRKLF